MKKDASFSKSVLSIVKRHARANGLNQNQLARRLGVSLPTIKRWLSGEAVSLDKLSLLCDVVGLKVSEVVAEVEGGSNSGWQYSLEQEEFLALNPDVLAFFDYMVQGSTPGRIKARFKLQRDKVSRYLSELESIGLVERHPGNRVRMVQKGEPVWRKAGPLSIAYRGKIINEFLSQNDTGSFLVAEILEEDELELELLIKKFIEAVSKFSIRSKISSQNPKPYGVYVLGKPFRWSIDKFLK